MLPPTVIGSARFRREERELEEANVSGHCCSSHILLLIAVCLCRMENYQ